MVNVRVAKDYASGKRRGFAFITMEDDSCRDEIFKDVHQILGRRVDVRQENDTTPSDMARKCFVGGLDPTWGNETFKA